MSLRLRRPLLAGLIATCLVAAGSTHATAAAATARQERTGTAEAAVGLPAYWAQNGNSFQCLTVKGASSTNGAPIIQYPCEDALPWNNYWHLQLVRNSTTMYHLADSNTGKCVTVQGRSHDQGRPIVLWECGLANSYDRWFVLDSSRRGWNHLKNADTGKCLTIKGASVATDAIAVQWTCDFSHPFNEEWRFVQRQPPPSA